MLSDVQFHRSTCVRRKFQLGRLRINFLVSFQQNCSIWTRAEVAVGSGRLKQNLELTLSHYKVTSSFS